VIIATGFESEAPEVLSSILPAGYDTSVPFAKSNAVEKVNTQVGGGLRKPRSVAKRVIGQDVFFIGPAAGDDLVDRNEILVKTDRSKKAAASEPQISISENLASIKFLVPYSAALARNVIRERKVTGPTLDTSAADDRLRTALVSARQEEPGAPHPPGEGGRAGRPGLGSPAPASDRPQARDGHRARRVHLQAPALGRAEGRSGGGRPLAPRAPQLGESSITSLRDAVEKELTRWSDAEQVRPGR
jgi:hypothetical protein